MLLFIWAMFSSSLTVREYKGHRIPQREDGYINATAMCKAGGKQWSEFRRLKSTEEYIEALESVLGIPRTLLVQTEQAYGKDYQGTWVHPRLACRLAQWISPEFAVVVDGWVMERLGLSPSIEDHRSNAIANEAYALIESSKRTLEAVIKTSDAVKQLAVGQERLSMAVVETAGKVDTLITVTKNHGDRISKLEETKRRDFPTNVKKRARDVSINFYGGKCPLTWVQVVDIESGELIPGVGQYEHYNGKWRNKDEDCWITSAQANREFNTTRCRAKDAHHFTVWRERWEALFGKQQSLPLF